MIAGKQADVIIFVVDGRGMTGLDEELLTASAKWKAGRTL